MDAIEELRKKMQEIYHNRPPAIVNGVELKINIEGDKINLEVISIIEDLRHDYEYFIDMASKAKNIIEEKRFLRVAYLTLNAYIEASINHLYTINLKDQGKTTDLIKRQLKKKNYFQKCEEIENNYLQKNILSVDEKKELREIRNKLLHFKGEDLKVWDQLSLDKLKSQKEKHELWLKKLREGIKIEEPNSDDTINFIRLFLSKIGIKTNILNETISK
jgi:hypothetical protein